MSSGSQSTSSCHNIVNHKHPKRASQWTSAKHWAVQPFLPIAAGLWSTAIAIQQTSASQSESPGNGFGQQF
jgi:hypothetical protein